MFNFTGNVAPVSLPECFATHETIRMGGLETAVELFNNFDSARSTVNDAADDFGSRYCKGTYVLYIRLRMVGARWWEQVNGKEARDKIVCGIFW